MTLPANCLIVNRFPQRVWRGHQIPKTFVVRITYTISAFYRKQLRKNLKFQPLPPLFPFPKQPSKLILPGDKNIKNNLLFSKKVSTFVYRSRYFLGSRMRAICLVIYVLICLVYPPLVESKAKSTSIGRIGDEKYLSW